MTTQAGTLPFEQIPDWQVQLTNLLTEQRSVCRDLIACAEAQSELLERERTEELLTLLTRRRTLVVELQRLSLALDPYKSNWDTVWNRLSIESQAALKAVVEEIQSTLATVAEHDARDEALLVERKQRVAQDLESLSAHRTSRGAYHDSLQHRQSRRSNKFVDETG